MAADPWAVVSESPAESSSSDPWRVVSEKPQGESAAERLRADMERSDPLNAIAEPVEEMVSSGYHAAVGGITGLARGAGTLAAAVHEGVPFRRGLSDAVDEAAETIRAEQSKGFKAETPQGRVGSAIANYIPQKQGQLANYLGGKATDVATRLGASPEVAGAIGATIDTAGNVVGPGAVVKGLKRLPSGEVGPPRPPPKVAPPEQVAQARAAGYVLKPSEAGGKVGKVAEGLSGSPRLSVDASIKNADTTNALTREEVGIPEGEKITRDSLRKAAAPHNAVYKEVEQLGDIDTDETYTKDIDGIGRRPGKSFTKATSPAVEKLRDDYTERYMDSADAVHEIKVLRAKGRKNLKAPNAPEQNELGHAQLQVADAIEDQLERHAATLGKTDLVERFRTARQELAKINNVREALLGASGDISAAKLSKARERGAPLSGNLKTIADAYDNFGEVMRDRPKLKNKIQFTRLDAASAAAGAALTATHHPVIGGALLAEAVAPPLARKVLLSERYQNKLAPGPKKPRTYTLQDLEDLEGGTR